MTPDGRATAPTTILETERLLLRHHTLDDAPFVLRLLNEPAWLRFIGDRGVRTLEDARGYIETKLIGSYRRHSFGLYLVALKGDAGPIGMCGLIRRESLEDVDLGFAFLSQHWGHGYAQEAGAAVLAHARGAHGLKRIVAVTKVDNHASIKVLERLGFRYERWVQVADGEPENKLFAYEFPEGVLP